MSKPEQPPNPADLTKVAGYYFWRDLPKMKPVWKGVAGIAVLTFLLGFGLAWYLVVASKNATIETLTTASTQQEKIISRLENEKSNLEKQNLDLKTALGEFTAPLKKRVFILASQLNAFAQACRTNTEPVWPNNEYGNRFEHRVNTAIAQLDEMGQHSDLLNGTASHTPSDMASVLTNSLIISRELTRLANNLKD